MKAILTAAVALGLCGLARAADDKKGGDPVGTWKCEFTIASFPEHVDLNVTKDGEKLVATMNWPDLKEVTVMDVKFKDGVLKFAAVYMELVLDFTLTLDGDKFQGKAKLRDSKSEIDVTGKREKKDK